MCQRRAMLWMPKCYSFPSDALNFTMKTQDPLVGQCRSFTCCLLNSRTPMAACTHSYSLLPVELLAPSRDPETSWAYLVPHLRALGSQQVLLDMTMLAKNALGSHFFGKSWRRTWLWVLLSHSAAVTGVFSGAVSGTTSTPTTATATTAFPGAIT